MGRMARLEQVIDGNNKVFIDSFHTVEMWLTVIRMYLEDILQASVQDQKVSIDWEGYMKRYQAALAEKEKEQAPVDEPPKKEDDPTTFVFGGT